MLAALGPFAVTPLPESLTHLRVIAPVVFPLALSARSTGVSGLRVVARVLGAVRMPLGAVRLRGVALLGALRGSGARGVLLRGHDREVVRVVTRPHAAEMVDVQPVGDRSPEVFVAEAVDQAATENPVAVRTQRAVPNPAVGHTVILPG